MRIGAIWAQARGGAIGRGGSMPWHLPEDLAYFRRSTLGDPVIMGRRTWESLPEKFRPLPGRQNVVVTRDRTFVAPGATLAYSLEEAIAAVAADAPSHSEVSEREERVWIMGGGELYRASMPLADDLLVTEIDVEVADADTFAPEIGSEWQLADPGAPLVSANGLGYRFTRYARRARE